MARWKSKLSFLLVWNDTMFKNINGAIYVMWEGAFGIGWSFSLKTWKPSPVPKI